MLDLTYDPARGRDPPCSACGKPLGYRVSTVFDRGEMFHTACWYTWLHLVALDHVAAAQVTRARARATRALTHRLLDQVSEELRRGGPSHRRRGAQAA